MLPKYTAGNKASEIAKLTNYASQEENYANFFQTRQNPFEIKSTEEPSSIKIEEKILSVKGAAITRKESSGVLRSDIVEEVSANSAIMKDYIRSIWGNEIDAEKMIRIINECENRKWNPYAYNPETNAILLGITKWPSCGIVQNNDARCLDKTSIIYDWKYSIDLGFIKYQSSLKRNGNGFYPWKNCAIKLGIL